MNNHMLGAMRLDIDQRILAVTGPSGDDLESEAGETELHESGRDRVARERRHLESEARQRRATGPTEQGGNGKGQYRFEGKCWHGG